MEVGRAAPMVEEERYADDSSSTSSCLSVVQDASEDEQFIRLLDAMDHLLTSRDSLSKSLSEGCMEIASARYSMGPSRISQALFSLKPYSASTVVNVSAAEDVVRKGYMEEDEQIHNLQPEFRFALHSPHEDCLNHNTIIGDGSAKSDLLSQSGLRRRRQASGLTKMQHADRNVGYSGLSGSDSDMAQDIITLPKGYDPLAWFGTLVSPHLRGAQTSFTEALETLVELATAQSTILRVYQHIKESGELA